MALAETIAPEAIYRGVLTTEAPWLNTLREAYARGSDERLAGIVSEFLEEVLAAPICASCDQTRHVFQVTFLATEAIDAPLVRLLLHAGRISRDTLPGVAGAGEELYELFVAEDQAVRLESVYESQPLENPLDKESAAFVTLALGKLALPVATAAAPRALRAEQRTSSEELGFSTAVTISRVRLPERRARITIRHAVAVNDPISHLRAQAAYLDRTVGWLSKAALQLNVQLNPGWSPECVRMANAIRTAIDTESQIELCNPLPSDSSTCFAKIRDAAEVAYLAAAKASTCKTENAYPLAKRFLSMVPEKAVPVRTGNIDLRNTPKTHWSVGLGTGFVAGIRTSIEKPRTKLSNGKFVVDPFNRLLAMGAISWSPAGYAPESVRLALRERFRVFGGVAFAPHFGGTAGASWALNRYVGASVGYAYLLYDTLKLGEQIDEEPTAANRAAPLRLAGTHAWFVGLTYGLGK